MTNPHIQKAGRAIAEVRERYEIHGTAVWDRTHGGAVTLSTSAECQAWIDEQFALAAFESVLPVGDDVVEASRTGNRQRRCGMIDWQLCILCGDLCP